MKTAFALLTALCAIVTPFAYGEPTMDAFMKISDGRHSGRAYDATRPVTKEQMLKLAVAAHNAPSCYNDQPWMFILCNRDTQPDAYKKVMGCLVEFNQNWAKDAPLLVVVVANNKFNRNDKDNRWGPFDTGAAAMSMALEAYSLGLMAHQMGGFDEAKIQKEFQIPAQYTPYSVMAIGYETAEEAAKAHPKERVPLEKNFFDGTWGHGIK